MLKVRYGDKKYLCEYDLNTDLFKEFSIEVEDLAPVRSVYILTTNKGKKILKKIDYSNKRLDFICNSLEYISSKYDNIMKINKNINEENFVCRDGGRYILIDLIEGRECATSNPVDMELSAKALARLHNGSIELYKIVNRDKSLKEYINIFNIEKNLEDSLKNLIVFKNQVSKYLYKNDFDNLFYKSVDYYINEIEFCKKYIENINMDSLIDSKDKIVLCHNDLAHHNILIKEENVYFIDFDYCKIDFRVQDLSNIIVKSIKNYEYDFDKCSNILKNYESINKLSDDEYKLLYLFMRYPKDFYTASKDYYLKQKRWEEEVYYWRFFNKVQFKESREEFLNKFYKTYIEL